MKKLIFITLILISNYSFCQEVPASQLLLHLVDNQQFKYSIGGLDYYQPVSDYTILPFDIDYDNNRLTHLEESEEDLKRVEYEYNRIIIEANTSLAYAKANNEIVELNLENLEYSKILDVREELIQKTEVAKDLSSAMNKAKKNNNKHTNRFTCLHSIENPEQMDPRIGCNSVKYYMKQNATEGNLDKMSNLTREYRIVGINNYEYTHETLAKNIMIAMLQENKFDKDFFNKALQKLLQKSRSTLIQEKIGLNTRGRKQRIRRSQNYFYETFQELYYPLVKDEAHAIKDQSNYIDLIISKLQYPQSKEIGKELASSIYLVDNSFTNNITSSYLLLKEKKILQAALLDYIEELKTKTGADILKRKKKSSQEQNERDEKSITINSEKVLINTSKVQELN